MRRFADAIAIQGGACNPHGIARSIVNALDELRAEGADTPTCNADPAVRLMVHQLAFLVNVGEFSTITDDYSKLMATCKERTTNAQ